MGLFKQTTNSLTCFKVFVFSVLCCFFCVTTSFGQSNGLSFDGIDDNVSVPQSGSLEIANGTVEAWFKTSGAGSSFRGIAVKQSDYGIFLSDNQILVYNWSNGNSTTVGGNQADGNWHHVAFTFQDGVTNGSKVYLDGNQVATLTYNVTTQTLPFYIGTGQANPGQNFNGTIDEVRVWNVVRTASQISNNSLCEFSSGMLPSGLVAYYKLNQGSAGTENAGATTATDATGSHNGTLGGFSLNGTTSNWVAGNSSVMGSCSVMAAELTGFSVKKSSEQSVLVDWKTGIETGNNQFDIERARDGRTFKKIGSVTAKGFATDYQFVDEQPESGTNYYRLTINDLEGEKYHSKVIAVAGEGKSKVKITPSVFRDNLTIEGAKNYEIVNMVGQIVERGTATDDIVQLQLLLPNGMYLVRGLDTEGGGFVQKIIRQ
jgi:hypothetical protein